MRLKSFALASVLGLSLVGGVATRAAEPAADADGYVSLFDGKTLDGWVVTECKVAVEDGKLVILDGLGFVRSEKIYGDFVLDVDWKNRKADKYDSGVYFRSDLPRPNNHWPDRYQINLLKGEEGTLVAHKTAKAKNMATPGEWNHFKLTCVGPKATLEINGKPAWTAEDIKPTQGYVGFQCEVPNGGQFEFRNIRIKPLTPPVTPPATQPAGGK